MNSKRFWKITASVSVMLALAALMIVLNGKVTAVEKERTCTGMKVEFSEPDIPLFVTVSDINSFIDKGYGKLSGKRLEEIDLSRVEEILDGKSAILKSHAYTTKDGVLHIIISQRIPMVRFVSGNASWYADENGFVFPVQKNYTSRVPIVDGDIPLNIKSDFKGIPGTEKERAWVNGILELVNFLNQNRKWADSIAQIHVQDNGHIIVIPRQGKEKFYLGRPEDYKRKFVKIENYYKYIVPAKGKETYSYVNVSFDGQIVCRK